MGGTDLRTAMAGLAMALAAGGVTAAAAEPGPPASITISAQARVEAAPDLATLTLGVENRAATAAEAMAETSAGAARVLERLAALGIAERDMQTAGIELYQTREEGPEGAEARMMHVASNRLQIRVRDLARLGEVIDQLSKEGANQFSGLSFSLADPAPLEAEARLRAVAEARTRAESLAEAAGVRLGRVLRIEEGRASGMPMPQGGMMMRAAHDSMPVATGEVGYGAQVVITWEIRQR